MDRIHGGADRDRAFVTSMFEKAGDEHRETAGAILKEYINSVHTRGALWTTDWASVIVPELEKLLRPKRKKRMFEEMPPGASREAKLLRPSTKFPPTSDSGPGYSNTSRVGSNIFDRLQPASSAGTDSSYSSSQEDVTMENWDRLAVVGTCQKLEKRYLRLTSEPDPTTVRPLHVLRETMKLLKSKWKADRDYGYICDQFKSVRQDLTVCRMSVVCMMRR